MFRRGLSFRKRHEKIKKSVSLWRKQEGRKKRRQTLKVRDVIEKTRVRRSLLGLLEDTKIELCLWMLGGRSNAIHIHTQRVLDGEDQRGRFERERMERRRKTNRLRLWVCLFSLMISSRIRFSGDMERFSGFSEERLMIDR